MMFRIHGLDIRVAEWKKSPASPALPTLQMAKASTLDQKSTSLMV
jgi:hypothetical protein